MFKDNVFLSKKELQVGRVYVFKDGSCHMYFGQLAGSGDYLFYSIGSLLLYWDMQTKELEPMHGKYAVESIINLAGIALGTEFKSVAMRRYSTLPKVQGALNYGVHWSVVKDYLGLYRYLLDEDLRKLDINFEEPSRGSEYIGVKQLKFGGIYYGGSDGWRNTFVYLGRMTDGNFLWFYISNDSLFLANPDTFILVNSRNFQRTTSNKRVREINEKINPVLGHLKQVKLSASTCMELERRFGKLKF